MKKRVISIVAVIGFVFMVDSIHASDFEDFINNVNSEWANQNYTNMIQVINNRLTTHTNDLAALLLKMNYHLAIEYDLSLAQSFIPIFTNTVASINWSTNWQAKVYCDVMIQDVADPSNAQSQGVIYNLSSNQLIQLHSEMPDKNPLSDIVLGIGSVQYSEE